eukprot:3032948-Rhodomonas_salina.2
MQFAPSHVPRFPVSATKSNTTNTSMTNTSNSHTSSVLSAPARYRRFRGRNSKLFLVSKNPRTVKMSLDTLSRARLSTDGP